MSRRRAFVDDLAGAAVGAEVRLAPAEARRLRLVLRLAPGAAVELLDGRGARAEGELVAGGGGLAVRLRRREEVPVEVTPLIVAVSAPKGARLPWLVEKLTELNVQEIHWVVAARSQPHSRAAVLVDDGRLRRLAEAAAVQSRAARLPRLLPPRPLDDWLADWRRAILPGPASPTGVFCRPGPPAPPLELPAVGPRVVLIGPEGGLTGDENDACLRAGLAPMTLGRSILRVETAALVAVARLG